tara:strand:- start:407 stop:826 length:420 start_codon:yes stop_codon:yes gene_type:complete
MKVISEEDMSANQRLLGVLIHLTAGAIQRAEDALVERDPERRDELLSLCSDMAFQMWRHWRIRLSVLGLGENAARTVNNSYDFIQERLEDELIDGGGEAVAEAIGLLQTIRGAFVDSRERDDDQAQHWADRRMRDERLG